MKDAHTTLLITKERAQFCINSLLEEEAQLKERIDKIRLILNIFADAGGIDVTPKIEFTPNSKYPQYHPLDSWLLKFSTIIQNAQAPLKRAEIINAALEMEPYLTKKFITARFQSAYPRLRLELPKSEEGKPIYKSSK